MRRFLFAIALLASAGAAALAQNNGDPKKGRQLFVKYGCYTCHGYEGQGTAAGAHLAPRPIATAALIAYVRHPGGQMPPYTAKVVPDADLVDIRAFLASVPE